MYMALFNIAGFAMLGWLLLILLPAWKVTRWIARTAVFPVFLSILYLVGISAVLMRTGPGIMSDFGNAEGVLRVLRDADIALVAWIHILAFDQLVALMIYRENMEHRYVPLPVQSVLLFFTLMFGPVGFLGYYLLRAWSRSRRQRQAVPAETEPAVGRVAATDGVAAAVRTSAAGVLGVFRREWLLTATGVLGLLLGMGCAIAIGVRGTELVGAEGHLRKAMAFDVAVGIYLLTLVLLVPLAKFSRGGVWAWRVSLALLSLYAYGMENVQIARGIDPRFTRVGSVTDQILGGVFFLTATGMIVSFIILAWKVLARRMDGADGPLLLSLRYAALATMGAFAAGFWMSAVSGSRAGEASILPLHAAGFHGLQALPLVAILLTWAGVPSERARGWIHAAGAAWLAACAAIAWQTAQGRPLTDFTPAAAITVASLLAWAAVAALAARTWLRGGGTAAPGAVRVQAAL
ncbi:ABA4-like family protein [Longimicrobium sp.]|uniref:ABA4-like family protein n=1 Tax=Longimicrobium sp. TaxID=2029185 RepID=UPI003B3B3945